MCGIVGIYQPRARNVELTSLAAMTERLRHRGPDDDSFAFCNAQTTRRWRENGPKFGLGPGIALGHRRLAIIGTGRQPLVSPDDRFTLVYNGALFNYRELRDELVCGGRAFETDSDSEVVLAAFEAWDTDCFARFNGMWALLLWDRRRQRLIASRDRFGIKPLHVQQAGELWLFASEVKALLEYPDAVCSPNRATIADYLSCYPGAPPEASLFEDVRTLPPGCWCELYDRQATFRQYWQAPDGATCRDDLDDAAQELNALLRDAVRLRMVTDTPLGCLMSGGLDSTSIACLATEHLIEWPLDVFSAVYDGDRHPDDDGPDDESVTIDEVVERYGLRAHRVRPNDYTDIAERLLRAVNVQEVPFGGPANLVHTMLVERAREHGVKVLLNGHGSDELFGGYARHYAPAAIADTLRESGPRAAEEEAAALRWNPLALLNRAKVRATPEAWRISRHLNRLREQQLLKPWVLARWRPRPDYPASSLLEEDLRRDFYYRNVPMWLMLEDRIGMSHGIEARSPFLDHRIVELAHGLGGSLKLAGGTTKRVLRHAMRGTVPDVVLDEAKKVPFHGPEHRWLGGQLRTMVDDLLLAESPRIGEYVEVDALRRIVTAARADDKVLGGGPLWGLLETELWLRSWFS